jgi:short-subunit dehydrogenase
LALECDVARDGDLERAAAAAREAFGRIDVVVANAGFGVTGDLESLELDDYRRQFETNVFGVLRTAYATLEDLKKTRGQFVVIGSVIGHFSLPRSSPYSMSKFAMRALTQSLYGEWREHGIDVTLIEPGFVASEFRQVDNLGDHHPDARDKAPKRLVVSTPKAVGEIIRAVSKRRREAVITGHGRWIVRFHRLAPRLFFALMGRAKIKHREQPK